MCQFEKYEQFFSENRRYMPALTAVQFALMAAAIVHVLCAKSFKRGNKAVWLLASLVNFVGPIAYFVFGAAKRGGDVA